MTKGEQAVSYHEAGFNCSQSVLIVFAEEFNLDIKTVKKISCGFGGGIGRAGETCGAVTGAVMVLGLKYGMIDENDLKLKEKTYEIVQEFIKKFKKNNVTSICNQLLGYDISIPANREIIKEKGLVTKVCNKVIKDAVEILEQILG